MTPPRRLTFSLKMMLAGVGLVAVAAAALTWAFRGGIEVYGDLSQSDLVAICEVISKSPRMRERRILCIRVINSTEVEVDTGVVHGPLDGHGETATLEKKNGNWTIAEVVRWVS